MRKAVLIAGACVLAFGGCAVSRAPRPDLSPAEVRTAWLSKGYYTWHPLVPAEPAVRHVKLAKKDTTTPTATVPRVVACDLSGFSAGCAVY
jgi:hypothetical protein